MKKLTIKELIEFKNKSERAKRYFAESMKLDIQPPESTEGGGNYWVTSVSAIGASYRANDNQSIKKKIDELTKKRHAAQNEQAKTMYKRNSDILYNFEDFEFSQLRPPNEITFIRKNKIDEILPVAGFEMKVKPNYVFTFGKEEIKEVGAIWLIAKLNGYSKAELGMHTDSLYRYLKRNFGKKYHVNQQYCLAIDIVENFTVSYAQIASGEVEGLLDVTLAELRKLV